MSRYYLSLLGVIALLAGAGTSFLPAPFSAMESQVTGLKYALRGPVAPDSSIVLVYVDEGSVRALGWPVRRNFYALMIRALADLQARAVGVEILFEEPQGDFPEYDELLGTVMRSSGTIVLPCYFERVGVPGGSAGSSGAPFRFPGVRESFTASGLHLPLPSLLRNSAGSGHVNYTGETDVPLFLRSGDQTVPAFALEVLRVSLGADRAGVMSDGSGVRLAGADGVCEFSVPGGKAALNFCGPLAGFRLYPFLQVLTSYDALRADRPPELPVASLKGKTVLVGVIAEGRSRFFPTPVDPWYPSLGLHATFLDNALHDRFLKTPPAGVHVALVVLLSLGIGVALLAAPERVRW